MLSFTFKVVLFRSWCLAIVESIPSFTFLGTFSELISSHRWVYPIIYLFLILFGTFFGVEALPSLSPSQLLPFLVYFWCRFVEALLLLSLSHLLLLQRDSWEAHQPSVCPEMPRFRPEKTLGKYTDGESAKYYWRHKDTKTLFSHFGFCLWQKYFK